MIRKHFLFASDFDQTLSFNDSGLILSQLIGASDFTGKVSGLSRMHFIQQGGELAYLLLHDLSTGASVGSIWSRSANRFASNRISAYFRNCSTILTGIIFRFT